MHTNPGNQAEKALEDNYIRREEAKLKIALEKLAGIDACALIVKIKKNKVYLDGEVDSLLQKDDAETVIWLTMPDAEDVINNLKVEGELVDDEVVQI